MAEKIRLQTYLASCGIGSRRTCESYIDEKRIAVDGIIIKEQGLKIDPQKQKITFDGKNITPQKKQWILLNKPPKYICSSKDQGDKQSFLRLLPKEIERVFAVGRLDYLSEGLLLVTNDGTLANKIIHPRYEIKKKYQIITKQQITNDQQKLMLQGIQSNNELLKILAIKEMKKPNESKYCYEIILGEGRNRHIRRMLSELSIPLSTLKRIQIGPISLGLLKKGEWRYLTSEEMEQLHKL